MTEQVKTFEDILNYVVRGANIAQTFATLQTDVQDKIKQLVNAEYNSVAYSRIWPWRAQQRWLKTTPTLSVGTVAVVNGDRNVTFGGAVTVTEDFKGRYVKVAADSAYYEIIAVDVGTKVCALSAAYDGTTNPSASFQVYRLKYGLWPDFADIGHIVPVTDSNPLWDKELDIVSPQDFIGYISNQIEMGLSAPVCASIFGKEAYFGPNMGDQFIMRYDFMNDPTVQDEEALWLWPPATAVLQIYYGKQVEPLVQMSDQPLMPKDKRVILAYGALEMWYATQVNNLQMTGFFGNKKANELNRMVGDFDKADQTPRLTPMTRRKAGLKDTYIVRRYYPWLIR